MPDSMGGDDAPVDGQLATHCSAADGWQPLISRSWSLAPGQETYRCKRIQVPADQFITGYCSEGPQGTHHTVLTISDSAPKLGDYDCSAGTLDKEMLFAGGVATDDLLFPTGVAIKLGAQKYINVNLHLFNTTDNTLSGTSGIYIKTIPQADVVHEADMVFSGTFSINIPSDNTPHTAVGGCTAPTDWHVFTVWPHMHQIATRQKMTSTASVGGAEMVLLDDAYDFNEQKNYPMQETLIHQGDRIQTTCTYQNNTGATVNWGDSSTQEMCFTGMYKWPVTTSCPGIPGGDCKFSCSSF